MTTGTGQCGLLPYLYPGSPATICTVSKLTAITRPIRSTMYCGSSVRFGSLTMPLRLSVLHPVLVDDPLQRRTVAQPVVERFHRDPAQGFPPVSQTKSMPSVNVPLESKDNEMTGRTKLWYFPKCTLASSRALRRFIFLVFRTKSHRISFPRT